MTICLIKWISACPPLYLKAIVPVELYTASTDARQSKATITQMPRSPFKFFAMCIALYISFFFLPPNASTCFTHPCATAQQPGVLISFVERRLTDVRVSANFNLRKAFASAFIALCPMLYALCPMPYALSPYPNSLTASLN